EPLQHPASVRAAAFGPRVPEAEALEQHPDALGPFGNAVQASVQVEVLDSGQLPVEERLVREIADATAFHCHLQLAASRHGEPGAQPQQRRLSGSVRAGDEQEPVVRNLELDASELALVAVTLLQPQSSNHGATLDRHTRFARAVPAA